MRNSRRGKRDSIRPETLWCSSRYKRGLRSLPRDGIFPAMRQAALVIALGSLVLGGLRLDEWARAEAQECRAHSRALFLTCSTAEVSWHPFRPSGSQANPGPGCADMQSRASTEADRQAAPEPWLFLRLTGPESKLHRFIRVHITGYTSCPTETNCMPHITASNTLTAPGTIALSRDLLRTFTPGAPFDFGDKILIPGVGIFEVWDTMNARWRKRADIWFEHKEDAREWGIREVFVTLVNDDAPTMAWCPRQSGP